MVSKDQAGHQRQAWSDGLGRQTQVVEDPGSGSHLNYIPNYYYDALDDLSGVNQLGQVRVFAYDSLRRLVGATNPENYTGSGGPSEGCGGGTYALCYSYDNAGNLLSKTDNRGAAASYSYDALNRVIGKAYTVPSGVAATRNVTYCYDGVQAAGCPVPGSVSNPVGD